MRYNDMTNVFCMFFLLRCGNEALQRSSTWNKPLERLIRKKGEKSGRREKQPKKLGRREKNRGKNREERYLTARSSPLHLVLYALDGWLYSHKTWQKRSHSKPEIITCRLHLSGYLTLTESPVTKVYIYLPPPSLSTYLLTYLPTNQPTNHKLGHSKLF